MTSHSATSYFLWIFFILMEDYRKKWVKHFGPIPFDENGRRYDIHHIDGNRDNNSISNLMAVSIEEHRNIHYRQQDWHAVVLIEKRLGRIVNDEIRKKIGDNNRGENNKRRIKNNKLIDIVISNLENKNFYSWKIAIDYIDKICEKYDIKISPKSIALRLEKESVILIENKNDGKRRLGNKNPMYGKSELQKEIQSRPEVIKKKLEKLCISKGPQNIVTCPNCLKIGGISNMKRYHFNNCKKNK